MCVAKRKIIIGDEFKLLCGVTVKVIDYIDSRYILVEDQLGNKKTTRSDSLRAGTTGWEFTNPDWEKGKKPSDIQEGDRYKTKGYGDIEVVKFTNCRDVLVKFIETGFVKRTTSSSIIQGYIKDNTRSSVNKHQSKYPIGGEFLSKNSGKFRIVDIDTCKNITIQWEESGHLQRYVSSARINDGNLIDESHNRDYLKPKKGRHYVYIAKFSDKIVYIGHGFKLRYLHPNSGVSHVQDLNRIFFLEEEKIKVEIFKDDLSKEDAINLEKLLIDKYKPIYNSRIYKL